MKNIFCKIVILIIVLAIFLLPCVGCDNFNLVEYQLTITSLPDKREYCLGENMTLNGLVVQVKNTLTGSTENYSTFTEPDMFAFSGYDNVTAGEKTVCVTYTNEGNSASATFTVEVIDVWLESVKTQIDISDMVIEAAADRIIAYSGGASKTMDIEKDIYLEIGDSKTAVNVSPDTVYRVGVVSKTLHRRYFETGEVNYSQYAPIKQENGKISIAWFTLMTTPFSIKISGYDTKYVYEYPYKNTLGCQIDSGRYIKFLSNPGVEYCYVASGSILSVETIKNVIGVGYCIEIKDGTVEDNANITIYVPGYAKICVTL